MIVACFKSPESSIFPGTGQRESKLLCRKRGDRGGLSWLSTGCALPMAVGKGML